MLEKTSLVITAWKRPEYLARTLESWAMTPELSELRHVMLALGWSVRYDDQIEVVRRAERSHLSRQVVIVPDSPEAAESPGMHRALGEAIDTAFQQLGTEWVLCGEEDVIVSADALGYVSWAQQHYDDSTLCICLHNRGGMGWDNLSAPPDDAEADQEAVREQQYFNPWGWCIRRDRWQQAVRPVWDWDCNEGGDQDSGYDWGMQRLSALGPWRNLVPDAARSQTIGELSGVYSTPDIFPRQQAKSFRRQREMPVAYRLES